MSRIAARNPHSSNQPEEANENEFENSLNSAHFPPPRTPLNTITDPSQFCKEAHESDFDSKEKIEALQAGNARLPGRKIEAVDRTGGYATPRVLTRTGKSHSEPNSLQNTPLRSGSRPSLGGAMGASGVGVRATHGKETSSAYRLSRRNSMEIPDFPVEAQHFELDDNHTFWADHNVQVLVRIRPLNNMERVSQGHGRCVRQESSQSLVWLGHPETRFTFDHIACETISQEKLFRAVGLPMVENCMSGYNSCMFAYGQTGSGKTYTMMGDINHQEGKFRADCGITPRTFEYLFSRIQMEEESRRNEKLRFSCKCSFLEIYNEQITDLLEPSSTNLQLREDLRRGVYVENLTECNVKTVDDVTKLISQGAANRKIAATNMNSESSRSHSVFTCIIESWWEKDSMTHYRFARLNLVDLAGSERQKSSGAEGERLKEAANINKSLSTLGLVIMSLVDLAHGKHRHVPYRDSRLTFLLQDSLGGNSKTAIIANISPSTCSALETLSTLKFAQRAKLIQNNATVNEDASGDVSALQRQIQHLKDQLSFLIKHHNLSPALCNSIPNFEKSSYPQSLTSSSQTNLSDVNAILEKNKCMEATVTSALRREKMAEVTVLKLEAEIDRVNQLASQREEEFQRIKMMLRFREEKIKSLESLLDDSLPADRVLMEENKALKEEICLLQERIDKNPELTRLATENLRLVEQIQLFQNYIEHGERERLLAEISELREQLLDVLETKSSQNQREDNDILKELEECRNLNSKLLREVSELRGEMNKYSTCTQASVKSSFCKDDEEIKQANNFLSAKNVSTQGDSAAEMASYGQADGTDLKIVDNQKMNVALANQLSGPQKELADARLLIEAMESEQAHLINKLQLLQELNQKYVELLKKSEKERVGNGCLALQDSKKQNKDPMMENTEAAGSSELRAKLEKLAKDLEQARSLNCQYQEDQASQLSQQHQIESIREQVEMETARTIIHLQEEVCALQSEFDEKLSYMSQENVRLKNSLEAKEEKIKVLCNDWEKATFELTSFLLEGSKSLEDASGQIQSIVCSFPQPNALVRENVERAAQAFIDKEEAISQLEKSLKNARKMVLEMEMMLYSLKEAAIALNENPESHDYNNVGEINLGMLLNDNQDLIAMLENQLRSKENHVTGTDHYKVSPCNDFETGIQISKVVSAFKKINHRILQIQNPECGLSMEDVEAQPDLENAVNTFYMDVERHVASFQTEMLEASTSFMEWVKDLVNEIQEMRSVFVELKGDNGGFQFKAKPPTSKPLQIQDFENQLNILQPLREELAQINERLKRIEYLINENTSKHGYLLTDESSAEADSWNTDVSSSSYSSSGCAFSSESAISGDKLDRLSYTCSSKSSAEIDSPIVDLDLGSGGSSVEAKPENSSTPMKTPCHDEAVTFCLRKELDMAFHSFNKLHAHLITNFYGNDIVDISYPGEMNRTAEPFGSRMQVAEVSSSNMRKVYADHGINQASKFLGKFDEARAVMREADLMLNAMLKENDNAKQLNDMWKQANEKLEKERSCLLEENMQLKACISSKEEGNDLLQDEICRDLLEVAKSVSLFEELFVKMQREVGDSYKDFYSQLMLMGREMLDIVVNSRSSVEDIFSEVMKKEFTLSILHQYVVGEAAHKIPSLNTQHGIDPFQPQLAMMNSMQRARLCGQDDSRSINQRLTELEEGGLSLSFENMMYENLSLKKKLERKEVLLKGLLFDLSLLQEAASDRKEIKDESENLILTLSRVRQELEMKTSQLDNLLVQYRKVKGHLADTENALSIALSDITQTKERIDELEDQNSELRMLLKDLYLTKSEAEEQLEEQKEVVRALEKEITHLTTSVESKVRSSVEGLEEELKVILNERDELRVEISSLNDKLEMAYAVADENEAIAVESRQETEASRIYAEQKEEEVKILEHSVEELESTINVLEKKVYEMNDEVERHRMIRESLEVELEGLRHRLMSVENFADVGDSGNRSSVAKEDSITRQLRGKLLELHDQIKHLERGIAEKDEEINQCKEYISELVVHSEAQASQFQDKYKTLEAMVHEVNTNMPNSSSATATLDKRDKSSVRTRGSSSPFRCISNIVQQMNLEKDQELSVARLRIEELEAALASRQKEVCMLNARLAAAESMTHDVIRDLLGVKFDMTNYADLIDQLQVQKLVEAAQQQTEEFHSKEQEICNLRREINYLVEEKERCISEINEKATELLAAQVNMEQLQDRDRLLTAQNEMLKMDKSNLLKRVAELDEMIKTLFKTGASTQSQIQKTLKTKVDSDLTEKVARSQNLLFRVNKELAEYHKSIGNHPNARINGNRRQNS